MVARWFCVVLSMMVCWGARAAAQPLDYSAIDAATVRVLGLGDVGVVSVERGGAQRVLAAPLAAHGSGVVVDERGLVLTAAHVVEGARVLAVVLPGATDARPAALVFADATLDVALLRVAGEVPPPARLAEADARLKVRQTVYVVGYPLDPRRTDPQSTRGVVSGVLPDGALQLDVTVNPGNSGGPLIDETEAVQGIVVARSRLEAGAVGLAYAVPVAAFRERVAAAAQGDPSAAGLTDERANRLAALVALVAQRAPELEAESLEAGAEGDPLGDEIRDLESKLEDSADAKLLVAAYFWNRHVALTEAGASGADDAREQAALRCRQALALEPALGTTSPFVRHVLREELASSGSAGDDWGAAAADGPRYRSIALRSGSLRVGGFAAGLLANRAPEYYFEESGGRLVATTAGVEVAAGAISGELLRVTPHFAAGYGTVTTASGRYRNEVALLRFGLEVDLFVPLRLPAYVALETGYELWRGPIREDTRTLAGPSVGLGFGAEALRLGSHTTLGLRAMAEAGYLGVKLSRSSPLAVPDPDEYGSPNEVWYFGRAIGGVGVSFW